MSNTSLEQARRHYSASRWRSAFEAFVACDGRQPLEGTDLECLAAAAFLCGENTVSEATWARAYHFYLDQDVPLQAARAAFWQAFGLLNSGEIARGNGWLNRAEELVPDTDSVDHGYIVVPRANLDVRRGRPDLAVGPAREALALARRFRDPDLATLAGLVCGHAQFLLGDSRAAFVYLDEVMVAVSAREVSPAVAGLAYCSVVAACQDSLDIPRAREWTAALSDWCAEQPEIVAYRGLCLVHRSEIMQFGGDWDDALDQARSACEQVQPPYATGAAFYQMGELHRLRGEFAEAEECYRSASDLGRRPEPGLMLLRLAQGQLDVARASAHRLLAETASGALRAVTLAAAVEVLLECDEAERTQPLVTELVDLGNRLDVELVRAIAAKFRGARELAEGRAAAALPPLREAFGRWQDLANPYEAARVRVLIGTALQQLEDADAADLEFDAARAVFERVEAAPDLRRLDQIGQAGPSGAAREAEPASGVLTPREVEVLRLVAQGKSNRAVANELVLSEKTVARHLSNIYAKLDLNSRAGATAYAYDHHVV